MISLIPHYVCFFYITISHTVIDLTNLTMMKNKLLKHGEEINEVHVNETNIHYFSSFT